MTVFSKTILTLLLICIVLPTTTWAKSILIVADEWPQMEVLSTFLEQQDYEVEKKEQAEIPNDLSEYDAVIQFVHRMLNDDPAAKLMNYANNGGRLIVLHHGISAAKKQTKGWYEFLGVELDRTEDAEYYYEWIHDIHLTLVNVNPSHYITSHNITYPSTFLYRSGDAPQPKVEYPALPLDDTEVFINHQFIDGREKTVLFGFHFEHPETGKVYQQDRGGWYKARGEGYVFYFMPGHTVEDFEVPQYPQLILNCITWQP